MAIVKDLWPRLKERPYIMIPGSNVTLRQQSIRSEDIDPNTHDQELIQWVMVLHGRGQDGQLPRATSIDLRVGCIMDGAIVEYANGKQANCGPSHPHRFCGYRSERHEIPANETITKVKICKDDGAWSCLVGICMTLSNRDEWGHLNHIGNGSDSDDGINDNLIFSLEPAENEVIVGFYGQSSLPRGYTSEFGILTARWGVKLSENVYHLPDWRNMYISDQKVNRSQLGVVASVIYPSTLPLKGEGKCNTQQKPYLVEYHSF
ncbi:hypothetical protein BDV38DRAFT_282757 [Aspergillus pseudotamarii]|uniref:Uncharacterized protein n=1 Tax=Aspergillus pseudotamarii TaxID=132259 RepID=A0A5N6SVH0_ASPPS|nr:uncharacterized protein BDV38DRAFT_282757 [Aspergillus pseudotamarii]KAE8137829.1 hypothetical protein BDV38DRAFT_282757 [Aspergillus pseudotamarii]